MVKSSIQIIKKVFFTRNIEVLTELTNKLININYDILLDNQILYITHKTSKKSCLIPLHNVASMELE